MDHPIAEVRQETLKLIIDISNHRNFSVNLPIEFIEEEKNPATTGEPREHRLGEFNNISSYLIVLFFGFRFPMAIL